MTASPPGRRTQRLHAAALAATDRGWPVFPLWPGTKRPAVDRWPQRATRDPDRIARWWAAAPYNVAITCGPAGLLVLDLDSPSNLTAAAASNADPAGEGLAGERQHGRLVLAELARLAGVEDPTATYTVATPSGEHRYFTVDVKRPGRCTTGALGPHVDTRAAGGYVVAAGSVRRIDGRRRYYRTTSPVGLGPVPAPGWLLDALVVTAAPAVEPQTVPPTGDLPVGAALHRRDPYVRAAVAAEVARVRGAGPGTRNRDLFTAALHLGQLAAAGLLDEDDVTGQLNEASRSHVGVEGFTTAEIDRAIGNGLRYGRQRPRSIAS